MMMRDDVIEFRDGGELIIYQDEQGKSRIECRLVDETIWLSQALMADLFGKDVRTVNEHLSNIYKEGELDAGATIRKFRIVRQEGSRQVTRLIDHYNLQAILAVGFRVKSAAGTRFRRWANTQLHELIVKGFVMDDERLKNPGGWDYFDELLARIREIRASEKRFYQKVRDLFALSIDYHDNEAAARQFFAEVQNKLIFAVCEKTAAELVVARADADAPNMALMSFSGSRVRKHDVIVAKNYLKDDEIDSLNRLVVIFLEQAELRVKERKQLTLDYWRSNVDRLLEFNERPVLQNKGSVSQETMKTIAYERYDAFDAQRRLNESRKADENDLKALENLQKSLKKAGKQS